MKRLIAILITIILSNTLGQHIEHFKTDDGEILYYSRLGTGPKVILLYGGPGYGANLMKSFMDTLMNRNEIILFEQRGTGLSKNVRLDSSTINLNRAVEDIENLRIHLSDSIITLCGYSWGGMLALAYAARYPSHVHNLVLVSPGPIDAITIKAFSDNINHARYPNELDSIKYWRIPENRNINPDYANFKLTIYFYMCYFYDHNFGKTALESFVKNADYNPIMSALMWKDLSKNFDLKEVTKVYKGPCSVIRGRQDVVPEEVILDLRQSLPQMKVYYIEKSGHFVDLERPFEFYRLLKEAILSYSNS